MGYHDDIIGLVGLSNVGKSGLAKRAEALGYRRYCIDDLIEAQLRPRLQAEGFKRGINQVADWMGLPTLPHSRANQETYLDLEERIMLDVLMNLQRGEKAVIDLTGSAAHLSPAVRRLLRMVARILYMENSAAVEEQDFLDFKKVPKPVYFGDHFTRRPHETNQESLERSWRRLRAYRTGVFSQMAHVSIPWNTHRNEYFEMDNHALDAMMAFIDYQEIAA
jgi:shikimate kinase